MSNTKVVVCIHFNRNFKNNLHKNTIQFYLSFFPHNQLDAQMVN